MDSPGQVRELATQPQAIIDLDISPDGARIATVGFEDQLRIYQAANGRLLLSAVCPCGDMDCVAFSSDGGWIAAGGRNGVVRIWDSQSGAVVADLSAQRSRVRSLEFTSDGQLVACGDDCCVTVARPSDPANPQTLARHAGKLYAVKLIGPNLLATGGSDDLIHIWDLNSLQEIDTLVGHVGTVSCLDATEALLVSGSFDTQIRIWESEQRASRTEQPPALGATWGQGIDLK
jgi:WD40 repeat protein